MIPIKKFVIFLPILIFILLGIFILWPKYQTYRAILFLNAEFHILKSKDEIIKLENLKLHEKYKHRYADAIKEEESWVISSEIIPVNKSYNFDSESNQLLNIRVFYNGKNNEPAVKTKSNLIKYLSVDYNDNYHLIWDIKYLEQSYHIVFRPTYSSEESWEGYILWIQPQRDLK